MDTVYPDYLRWRQATFANSSCLTYEAAIRQCDRIMYGTIGFYADALRRIGYTVYTAPANDWEVQGLWAAQYAPDLRLRPFAWQVRLRRSIVPWVQRRFSQVWMGTVLERQVSIWQPSVVVNMAMSAVPPELAGRLRGPTRRLIGQHAATRLNDSLDWSSYDAVMSSFPPTLHWCERCGITARYIRLAFDESALSAVGVNQRDIPLSFIGSFEGIHSGRTDLLEAVAAVLPLHVWGPRRPDRRRWPHLARAYHGPAWGVDMYRVLGRSQIVLNHHGNVPQFANNLRMYEATGMGALLLTDWKPDLGAIFQPDRECVAYQTADECIQLARQYLADAKQRTMIASAGQLRTLSEHTYSSRAKDIAALIRDLPGAEC